MATEQTQQQQSPSQCPAQDDDRVITSEDFEVFNDYAPQLQELCDAAAEIAYLYDPVGMGLGLTRGQVRTIRANTAGRDNQMQLCLTEVFSYWKNGMTSPYTWKTFASVLLKPQLAMETKLLLKDLHKKLTDQYLDIR